MAGERVDVAWCDREPGDAVDDEVAEAADGGDDQRQPGGRRFDGRDPEHLEDARQYEHVAGAEQVAKGRIVGRQTVDAPRRRAAVGSGDWVTIRSTALPAGSASNARRRISPPFRSKSKPTKRIFIGPSAEVLGRMPCRHVDAGWDHLDLGSGRRRSRRSVKHAPSCSTVRGPPRSAGCAGCTGSWPSRQVRRRVYARRSRRDRESIRRGVSSMHSTYGDSEGSPATEHGRHLGVEHARVDVDVGEPAAHLRAAPPRRSEPFDRECAPTTSTWCRNGRDPMGLEVGGASRAPRGGSRHTSGGPGAAPSRTASTRDTCVSAVPRCNVCSRHDVVGRPHRHACRALTSIGNGQISCP